MRITNILPILMISLILSGCSTIWTRTIYVPDGKAVRMRQTVKKAKVWVKVSEGDIAPGRMDIPEGWYCLPMSEDK